MGYNYGGLAIGGNLRTMATGDVMGSAADEAVIADHALVGLRIVNVNTFTVLATLPTSLPVQSVVVADLDGDGDRDIAASAGLSIGNFTGSLIVWLNAGGFSTASVATSSFVERLTARDMDQDGDVDLVVGKSYAVNDGAGGFPTFVSIASSTPLTRWIPGDFDGDGDVDLITTYVSGGFAPHLRIFRRNANGSFTLLAGVPLDLGYGINATVQWSEEVADMNGDGIDDLVTAHTGGLSVSIYNGIFPVSYERLGIRTRLGAPGFAFLDAPVHATIGRFGSGFRLVDLDGDGDRDVIGLLSTGYLVPLALLNDGQGTLKPAHGRLFSDGSYVTGWALDVGDFDGDGSADVAVLEASPTYQPGWIHRYRFDPVLSAAVPRFEDRDPMIAPFFADGPAAGRVVLPDGTPCYGTSVLRTPAWSTPPVWAFTNLTGETGSSTWSVVPPSSDPFEVAEYELADGTKSPLYVTPAPSLLKIQGDHQEIAGAGAFPVQLGVDWPRTLAELPATVSSVNWFSLSPAVSVPSSTYFDSEGRSFATATTTGVPGVYTVLAQFGNWPPAPTDWATQVFTLTVAPNGSLTTFAGSGAFARPGEVFPAPLTARIVDTQGTPLSGVTLSFAVTSGAVSISAATAVTDAQGLAAVGATSTGAGRAIVTATSAGYGSTPFELFTRRLEVVAGPSELTAIYRHERPGVPILLMVDVPQAGTPLTTPFGEIHTSILDAAPTVILVDGLGLFGPVAPGLTTNINGTFWRRFKPLVPAGLSWVAQVLAYDLAYSWPLSLRLSNPVSFTF